MTNVPNQRRVACMGRWLQGLLAAAALTVGCASAASPEQIQQSTVNDGGSTSDFAGQQCVDGAACVTGSPGACGAGKVSCQGGALTCVPASTTQACYSGPAATRDVGTCKSGTQTCIGALGTCGGEVLPAAVENCFNDLDDDCAGFIPGWWTTFQYDTGSSGAVTALGTFCESGTLTLSATNQLSFSFTKQGNGTAIGYAGANSVEDDCAANEVLIGYDGRSGNWF